MAAAKVCECVVITVLNLNHFESGELGSVGLAQGLWVDGGILKISKSWSSYLVIQIICDIYIFYQLGYNNGKCV